MQVGLNCPFPLFIILIRMLENNVPFIDWTIVDCNKRTKIVTTLNQIVNIDISFQLHLSDREDK